MQLDYQERIFPLLIPPVYSIFKQERCVISSQLNRHELSPSRISHNFCLCLNKVVIAEMENKETEFW